MLLYPYRLHLVARIEGGQARTELVQLRQYLIPVTTLVVVENPSLCYSQGCAFWQGDTENSTSPKAAYQHSSIVFGQCHSYLRA